MIGELDMKKDSNSASSMPYSGVGRFFSPDGDLDETAFRNFLLDSIKDMNLEGLEAAKKAGKIGKWLTEYLSELFDYLEEKGMGVKSVRLFRLAMDVAADYHINNVTLPMRHMKNMLQNVEEAPVKPEKKVAKDRKREAIFSAALKVFAEKGYHRATIDEIASLSGIGKGSVYRYFRSKEDLLKQLIYAKDDEILQSIRAIFAYDEDILVQLQKMITVWIEFIEDNYVVYNLVQNDSIRQIVGDGVMFYDYFITHLPLLKEKILAVNEEDELKTTSFYTVYYGIMGFIDGVAHKWFRRGMSYPLRDELPVIFEVLFNGFVGEKRTGKNYITGEPR
jgi:AcrR family transcriptional regulator